MGEFQGIFNHFQNSDTKQLHLGKTSIKLRVAKCRVQISQHIPKTEQHKRGKNPNSNVWKTLPN